MILFTQGAEKGSGQPVDTHAEAQKIVPITDFIGTISIPSNAASVERRNSLDVGVFCETPVKD
jgi:hypothetical protein